MVLSEHFSWITGPVPCNKRLWVMIIIPKFGNNENQQGVPKMQTEFGYSSCVFFYSFIISDICVQYT